MMGALRIISKIRRLLRRPFARDEDGAVLVETIVILPVMIVFLVGILEFGALLYNKIQVETGLKDGTRYLARCNVVNNPCSEDMARNIAVFGTPEGGDSPRARYWSTEAIEVDGWPTTDTDAVIRMRTSFQYGGSPLIGLIGLEFIPVAAFHEERFIGW